MAVVRRVRCIISHIVHHGAHVYTWEMLPERVIPPFQPGQFLHLALDEYDPAGFWPESRAFSIASSPAQRDLVRISFATKGKFTSRMESESYVGNCVWIKLPFGDFTVDRTRSAALFAGGTGITAFSAFIETLKADCLQEVYLFYGALTPDLLIYRDIFEQVEHSVPQFHAIYYTEIQPQSSPLSPKVRPGRLSVSEAYSIIPHPLDVTYYLSGPPPMIETLSADLRGRQVKEECIRIDAWE